MQECAIAWNSLKRHQKLRHNLNLYWNFNFFVVVWFDFDIKWLKKYFELPGCKMARRAVIADIFNLAQSNFFFL